MKLRRVAITGLGVVASNGIGKDQFWNALLSGTSGIRPSSGLHSDVPCKVVGEVGDFDVALFASHLRSRLSRMSRISQFAVASASMALEDSGLDISTLDATRLAVCFGTTLGKTDVATDFQKFHAAGIDGLAPQSWTEFSPHAATSHIADTLGITGPTLTCSAGCSTGLITLAWAANQVATDTVDVVLAGSGDSLLSPFFVSGLQAGDLLTQKSDPLRASRPYDLTRDGLVPSEAAGVVILESYDDAVSRGAQIYAEYLGYACGTAVKSRGPNGHGLADVISAALRAADVEPADIDCINAHGLSHPVFDRAETSAFKSALGRGAYHIPVTSIKSMLGASFAGDGILQVISSSLILRDGIIPPTINLETPDPECDLDYVPQTPRVARVRTVLTNTRAIGGTHAALVLGRPNA